MIKHIYVCFLDDLRKKEVKNFYVELRDEIITYLDDRGQIFSFSVVCPHMAGEIFLDSSNSQLRCKWHGAKFSLNGDALNCKAKIRLYKYKTIQEGEKVFIEYDI
jgi:nitrite reductase/ring-hydroxylating ferredoxin subunit